MSLYHELETSHEYDEVINKHLKNRYIDFPHMDTHLNKPEGLPEQIFGSVNFPIHLTSTYAQTYPGKPYNIFEYSRCGNPSVESFEK